MRHVCLFSSALLVVGSAFAQTTSPTPVQAAIVNHGIVINGIIQGSIQQNLPEMAILSGNGIITGALQIPGTPSLINAGNNTYGGTTPGAGNPQPSGYLVILNGAVTLGQLVPQTDPTPLPTPAAPAATTGTVDVTISAQGQSVADFSCLRNLSVSTDVNVAVPAGTYGDFSSSSNGGFVLGVAGSSTPAVYNLNSLTLSGGSSVQVVGPVVLNLATNFTMNGVGGNPNDPQLLTLNVPNGDVTLAANVSLYGTLVVPAGEVTLNGTSQIQGCVEADRLVMNSLSQIIGAPGACGPASSPSQGTGPITVSN